MTSPLDYQTSPSARESFLEVFRRHGAGVSIITLLKPSGEPTGFTATSLSSLSLLPPRASFNMSIMASSWSAISASDSLLIHTLSHEGHSLATQFSGDASSRFEGIELLEGPEGLPLVPGASGYLHAKIVDRHTVGDAAMVAVEILGGGLGVDGGALVYQHQDYRVAADL
ncbi:flavin reductase [Pontimonas salivibrio]|jgi:flavin reductase (DIM6/NTAB) family NADH-FMN oxidoreductase RutF|uniref:Flavin reductase n=1 Tax=Pontimonas salivibrio TaxID=1159327 RepID=A0A2L2BQL7_9MICO|nr:flavin reductase family protein [Pontimonas salivibrio]AVG23959.1 flavin reductase [Pontimonas salivibrio]